MQINLGIGIENIKFGLNPTEIENLLGKPDSIRKDGEYGEFEPMYCYNGLQTRLTFYKNHEDRLGYIRSSNKKLIINNQKIIGRSISKVLAIFKELTNDDWELDEYDFWNEYFNEKYWIILRFNYDTLSEIEMGVPFKDEEQYNWPK
jgi:hypothetical protein